MKGSLSNLYILGVKYIIAVFSALKVTLFLLSHSSALLIIVLIPCQLLYAVGLVIYVLKLSINIITSS